MTETTEVRVAGFLVTILRQPRVWLLAAVTAALFYAWTLGPVGWAYIGAGLLVVFVWSRAAPRSLAWVAGVHRRDRGELNPEPAGPLAPIVPPRRRLVPVPPPVEGLHRLVVGKVIGADGRGEEPWTVNLLGSHLLVAGLIGSGKSMFLRALIESMAEWIRHGEVQLWGLDPKRVEFVLARPLFTKLWTPRGEPDEKWGIGAAALLDDAIRTMNRRLDYMEDMGVDTHRPTVEHPHIVVVADEAASLLRTNDPKIGKRIAASLDRIVREGRAPRVSLVLATQEPRKDLLDFRDNIPNRVCFRVASHLYPDMVLYDGAREHGAYADRIPETEPGTAYAVINGGRAQRVLAHKLDIPELRQLSATFAAPRTRESA